MIKSEIVDLGGVQLPAFTGTRAMMMPFRAEDEKTVPFVEWRPVVSELLRRVGSVRGVAYLTLDEALVRKGETHRRPGLHVDGARAGDGWSPPNPTPYGYSGMILVSSHVGCAAYPGEYDGDPLPSGDCEHVRSQLRECIVFAPRHAYWCGHHALHEALPMPEDTRRQLLRISMPSPCAWFENYTPSPYGIQPTGDILPARAEMNFRSK